MKEGFFSRLDWAAFWTATLATAAVYFATLGPSVGLEDSGELATAAASLGVPHPPGYPFWTFCSWIFCKAFFWVTYMGHPTPAWAVSLCSATFGAFAAGCTAMLICRSGRDFVGGENDRTIGYLSFGGGVGGALTFAFSPVEWSQSTIVEVYSLNALFLMWVFLLSYRWMRRPSDKILWFAAFVFGLGLTNYQVLLFAIVPLAIIMAVKNLGMFRDVFIYLIPVALVCQLLQIGQLVRADATMQADAINKHAPLATATTPSEPLVFIALAGLLVAMFAAIVLANRGSREKARKTMYVIGGLSVALVLLAGTVFASKTTWSGVSLETAPLVEPIRYVLIAFFVGVSVIAAMAAALDDSGEREYRKALLVSAIGAALAIVCAALVPIAGDAGYTGPKYPWFKSTVVFVTLLAILFGLCLRVKKGLAFAIPVAGLHIAAFILLRHGALNGLTHPSSWYFIWPIVWNFILLLLAWATLPNGRSVAGAAFFAQLGASFYVYMPIVSDLRNPPMNWGYPRTWEGFKHAIQRGQYEAIGLPSFPSVKAFFEFMGKQMSNYFGDVMMQFTDFLVPFALVPFAAGHWLVKKENRKAFWQWMIPAVVCFLMMSGLLILLANVKGDVQDGFIQKVKFISSHAMIALWIGYGLLFVGVFVRRWIPAALFAIAIVLVAGVCPIVQNYVDDRLVFELGGAEQNGHTFGWQFGAYQLDGAKAINEQLVADEEPLPDPEYPPAMDEFSIFFGGTDPGRFVPTYMIYAADFRPDVYLITQNALADDTYMSVQRDLYGDEIWIPAKEDGAEAFDVYVDEVQRGVRQANGDLKIENGRVQVTGALGVMEINGILSKMMFDHDRFKHSFYVEESYVIPWMYPYLSPHGLIMKLNAEKSPYDDLTAEKDADFWDWYFRRLVADPNYRRDFAGQKSFSKLRAALAGLYNNRARYSESAQAFREAMILYPASPEATFRYAQESLLPFGKYDVALELMDYTDSIDPRNRRAGTLRMYVVKLRRLKGELATLERKRAQGVLSDDDEFRLARCEYELGRIGDAGQIARRLVDKFSDAAHLQALSLMLADAHIDVEAEKCLNKYLRVNPRGDVEAWIDLALVQWRLARKSAAAASFEQALRIDSETLQGKVQRDERLYDIYVYWYKQRQSQMKTRSW